MVGDNASTVSDVPLLSCYADDPEMRDIVALFVSEVPDRLREVREAWHSADLRRVRTISHQIKGAAGGYGYPEVSSAAAELEAATGAANASIESASSAFAKFTRTLGRVAMAD